MAKSILKRIIICIPAIIVAGMSFSCRNKIEEIKAITNTANLPVQTSYNTEFYFTELGVLRNKLFAAKFDRYAAEESVVKVSGGFVLTIYDTSEVMEAEIKADNGIFYETEGRMEAHNNVELYNITGDTLKTEKLVWLQDSSKVFTDKFVTIQTKKGVIYGQGFESNESFTSYRILKPAGDLYIEEKSDTNATETE